jgi:DNA helicase-2/ATP-dependent DNA helicase PcrA
MQEPTIISSDDTIQDFDSHIKVLAGPGAGKTTWLVSHISYVARKSKRLHKAAKIVCISYTNAASEAIRSKLGECADIVETSTIHSFLFSNVVRPYLHMLKDEKGQCLVAHSLVQNHYEPNPTYGRVDAWLTEVKARNKADINNSTAYVYLKKALWQRQGDGTWKCAPIKWTSKPKYMPTTKLHIYKELLWKKGIIEHDDVLYFAYLILDKYPLLADHLGAKFPYIYIDEFQDTDPRQTQILKWIAEAGNTYVGVIGDSEQAIFGFCGAKREDFMSFELPETREYTIADNWRSTDNIIAVLNNARTDGIQQKGLRTTEGSKVEVLVGDINKAYAQVKNKKPVMLARSNEMADLLRTKDFAAKNMQDPWSELETIDLDRFLFVKPILEAFMFLKSGRPSSAVRKFLDGFRVRKGHSNVLTNAPYITDTTKRALALTLLCYLQTNYDSLCNKPFFDTYNELGEQVAKLLLGTILKRIMRGKIRDYAQKVTLQQLLDTVNMVDDTREAKTIHKAKGAEFETVLLCLPDEEDVDKIFMPKAKQQEDVTELEEQRIAYVGISRARDNLYISIPTLSSERKRAIEDKKLPIQIVDLQNIMVRIKHES